MTREQYLAQCKTERDVMREAVDAIAAPACDHMLSHVVAVEVFTTTLCALLGTIDDPVIQRALRDRAKHDIDAIDTSNAKVSLGAGKFGTA